MATPLVTAVVNKLGKTIFRQGGKFISRSTFLREVRRGPGGRFVSAVKHARSLTKPGLAQHILDVLGPPIGGGDWVSRVRKSEERFIELLGDSNQLG